MKIIKWHPMNDMMLVEDFFEALAQGKKEKRCTWSPSVDVYETEAEFVLSAELPGVQNEDISLTLDEGVLTLKGDRRFEKDVKQENYYRIERNYGHFNRRFALPGEVEADNVAASFEDGILKVVVPKSKSKKVKVQVGMQGGR